MYTIYMRARCYFFLLLVCTFKKGYRIFEVKVDVQKGPLSFSFNKITFRCYYCLSFNDMCLKVSYHKLNLNLKKKRSTISYWK